MSDYNMRLKVHQDNLGSASEGVWTELKGSKRGEACIIDFYTEMMLEGRAFQIRGGTISVPLVGTVTITDTQAEMCVDAPNGITAMIVALNLSINLGAGTLHEYALKSVDAVSTSGTAFVPLSCLVESNQINSRCTARVAATAGTVTVTAETATTTRRHWSGSNPVAVGAGHSFTSYDYQPRTPPSIANAACAYVQLGAATTGPSWFGSMDFIELPWVNVE